MTNLPNGEVYACDSEGYAEYFASNSQKKEGKSDRKIKNLLSNYKIKKIKLSK